MQCISDPTQLIRLGLPNRVYKQLLEEIITIPFGTIEEAVSFWSAQSVSLVLVETGDQLDQLLTTYPQLTYLIQYPEFVTHLGDDWYLILSITTSEGDGDYLVVPMGFHPKLDQLIDDHR